MIYKYFLEQCRESFLNVAIGRRCPSGSFKKKSLYASNYPFTVRVYTLDEKRIESSRLFNYV